MFSRVDRVFTKTFSAKAAPSPHTLPEYPYSSRLTIFVRRVVHIKCSLPRCFIALWCINIAPRSWMSYENKTTALRSARVDPWGGFANRWRRPEPQGNGAAEQPERIGREAGGASGSYREGRASCTGGIFLCVQTRMCVVCHSISSPEAEALLRPWRRIIIIFTLGSRSSSSKITSCMYK